MQIKGRLVLDVEGRAGDTSRQQWEDSHPNSGVLTCRGGWLLSDSQERVGVELAPSLCRKVTSLFCRWTYRMPLGLFSRQTIFYKNTLHSQMVLSPRFYHHGHMRAFLVGTYQCLFCWPRCLGTQALDLGRPGFKSWPCDLKEITELL